MTTAPFTPALFRLTKETPAMNTTATARETATAALRSAIERDHRIDYRAALRAVAHVTETDAETTTVKAAIVTEHRARSRDRVRHLVSPSVLDLAGLEAPEPYDMDYLISSL